MALELPGFYFDPELNRYFPLSRKRGRGGAVQSCNGAASSSKQESSKQGPDDVQEDRLDLNRNPGVLQLLQAREHSSGYKRISSNERDFRRQFLESQAAHPQVWGYDGLRAGCGMQQR